MFSDGSRLYKAQFMEPIAGHGDCLFLLDQTGPMQKYGTPFFWVKSVQPFFGPTPHALLLLWSQGAAAPAGYGTQPGNTNLIAEAQTGNINAGNFVTIGNPKLIQGAPQQLIQARWLVKTLALTGIKEHDLEVRAYNPGKNAMYGLANAAPGYWNMVDQSQDPADGVDSPAQGSNQTLPAAFPAVNPWDQSSLTEMYIWEQNGPTFEIWNNGSAAVTAGAIGIKLKGFRYDLVPVDAGYFTAERIIWGIKYKCPPTDRPIIVVPTGAYTLQPGQQ